MAFNGYQYLFRKTIDSHRAYADKHGFAHAFVDQPSFTPMLLECTWLKVPLLLSAMAKGFDYVLFVDSDAELKPDCPNVLDVVSPGKSIYMVDGRSGRVNAGVIFAQRTAAAARIVQLVLSNFNMALPKEDSVGWGENGHWIHFTKNNPALEKLDLRWNNTFDPALSDYIRHYAGGPMRQLYPWNPLTRLAEKITHIAQRMVPGYGEAKYDENDFPARLMSLFHGAVNAHPDCFAPLTQEQLFQLAPVDLLV